MTNNDLINKIKRLKIVEPSESWLKSNREFIFKYIDLDEKKETVQSGSIFSISAIKNRITFALSIFQNRILAGAVAMAAIFILVGSFVTSAAEGSLPGDKLYAVKTFMEKAQLAFAYNDEKRVALNFELTEKRLDEFSTIAAKKDENSSEVKTAADNLKNQLKVAAQELNSAKNNSNVETAVSLAKIADTKTTAYAKKLNEVKKDLSNTKQDQVDEVASNVEELSNSALAVLATNSKAGDQDSQEVAAKLKDKIISTQGKIDSLEKNVSLYEAEINNGSGIENKDAADSLALSVKLISEAKAVLAEAQLSFDSGNFSKTWDLLVNTDDIVKVAENVGSRVAVAVPTVSPSPVPSTVPSVSPSPEPSVSPVPSTVPSVSPSASLSPEASVVPSPTAMPSPIPSVTPEPSAKTTPSL